MLAVSLLGGFQISVDGDKQPVSEVGSATRHLIGFLCVSPGKAHRREYLAEMFWPDVVPNRARAALNTALWRLRKLLLKAPVGSGVSSLVTAGDMVVLAPSPYLWIDVPCFVDDAKAALSVPQGGLVGAQLRSAEAVVKTYEGPFLDGEDGDWILAERERLHTLFARVGTLLIHSYGQMRCYEDGIALARRILALDPYREGTLRDLLALLVLNGQRAEALRYFERWGRLLQKDLGIEPLPLTTKLADEIRSGAFFMNFKVEHELDFGASWKDQAA